MRVFKKILQYCLDVICVGAVFIISAVYLIDWWVDSNFENNILETIPKEFFIEDTVYTNFSIGCSAAVFQVKKPDIDVEKIHSAYFPAFYYGIDIENFYNDNLQGAGSNSGHAIAFGKACLERKSLSEAFMDVLYDRVGYVAFGGYNSGGSMIVYSPKENLIYYVIGDG